MSKDINLVGLDIKKILQYQRNRYPFLFLDRIISIVPGEKATGIKCFTYNEMFIPGHFDDEPNVPGFLQLECLVQTFLMTFQSLDEFKGLKVNDAAFNNVKFKRKIIPGDVLLVEAELHSIKEGVATGSARSTVDAEVACSADFVVDIPEILNRFKPNAMVAICEDQI
jgi:3-hydroxyacyl-[acyl-carrier-protein] dehydratase